MTRTKRDMATIVKYTDKKRPANAYPKWIISPVAPSLCCYSNMERVGVEEHEEGWSFIYKRCKRCGFTVRHVLTRDPRVAIKKGSRFDYEELTGGPN
jgi:hypothetical protein